MSINLLEERHIFHRQLTDSHTLSINSDGVASNADKSQRLSCEVALRVARKLGAAEGVRKLDGQSAGRNFEAAVSAFVSATFPALSMLRPGHWEILNVGSSRQGQFLAQFEPYRHLRELTEAIEQNPALATVLGNSYDISPDVLVLRKPVPPQVLTESGIIIDGAASYSPLVSRHSQAPIVHAVISCKWTLRSDRAQNARSEALNLIRNRKGRTPHIVVVTGEPMPSRLASLALGTGDIDTMYHFALSELVEATRASRNAEAMKTLDNLINGQRLRDLPDQPLDFAIYATPPLREHRKRPCPGTRFTFTNSVSRGTTDVADNDHTSKGVEMTMPPVSICPAMSDRPSFSSEESIGVYAPKPVRMTPPDASETGTVEAAAP